MRLKEFSKIVIPKIERTLETELTNDVSLSTLRRPCCMQYWQVVNVSADVIIGGSPDLWATG